ncbi:MAG: TIGR03915 family putative DNA repair protein [Clostridiales bacterium]|nr:TIGR03915 family putative DNA repair protein [Clostridiales bacterium]
MYVFICENSLEGILTGVYDACASRLGHRNIRLYTGELHNYELFTEYISVTPSEKKAKKVIDTLISRFGRQFYESIYQAAMSGETHSVDKMDKADAIYETILLALASGDGQKVLLSLGEPCVYRIFELCRSTNREACRHLEFLRFSELENGVLFAEIHPKAYVLPYISEHFTDRLPQENFMIYDATHQVVSVHKASKGFILITASELDVDNIKRHSEQESEYRKLWLTFFDHIAIDARRNPKLQKQLMPKRYWADTPELARFL